ERVLHEVGQRQVVAADQRAVVRAIDIHADQAEGGVARRVAGEVILAKLGTDRRLALRSLGFLLGRFARGVGRVELLLQSLVGLLQLEQFGRDRRRKTFILVADLFLVLVFGFDGCDLL